MCSSAEFVYNNGETAKAAGAYLLLAYFPHPHCLLAAEGCSYCYCCCLLWLCPCPLSLTRSSSSSKNCILHNISSSEGLLETRNFRDSGDSPAVNLSKCNVRLVVSVPFTHIPKQQIFHNIKTNNNLNL